MHEEGVNLISILIVGTCGAFLFVAAIVAFVMQYYKRVFIHQQELKAKELEKERDLLLALMEGRENEQKRLSEELHDGLAIDITVIKQQLYVLRKQLGEQEQYNAQFDNIKALLVAAGENVRAMSHNLTPANIEKFGLGKTLADMIAHINRNGAIKAEVHTSGEIEDISKNEQLIVYRIIQELVQNIHKHASASFLSINIAAAKGTAIIVVKDNGKGLPTGADSLNLGIGLTNIKSRTKLLKGEFTIANNESGGTVATLQFGFKKV